MSNFMPVGVASLRVKNCLRTFKFPESLSLVEVELLGGSGRNPRRFLKPITIILLDYDIQITILLNKIRILGKDLLGN